VKKEVKVESEEPQQSRGWLRFCWPIVKAKQELRVKVKNEPPVSVKKEKKEKL
jgi:hypothetical protein